MPLRASSASWSASAWPLTHSLPLSDPSPAPMRYAPRPNASYTEASRGIASHSSTMFRNANRSDPFFIV